VNGPKFFGQKVNPLRTNSVPFSTLPGFTIPMCRKEKGKWPRGESFPLLTLSNEGCEGGGLDDGVGVRVGVGAPCDATVEVCVDAGGESVVVGCEGFGVCVGLNECDGAPAVRFLSTTTEYGSGVFVGSVGDDARDSDGIFWDFPNPFG